MLDLDITLEDKFTREEGQIYLNGSQALKSVSAGEPEWEETRLPRAMDESLEEAAMDLGCGPLRVLFDITLPLIAPAMLAGWLLAFTLSLDDLVIASFTAGPSATTLPIKIFSSVRLGVSPEINALSTILIAIVATGVITASLVSKRAIARQRQDQRAAVAGS